MIMISIGLAISLASLSKAMGGKGKSGGAKWQPLKDRLLSLSSCKKEKLKLGPNSKPKSKKYSIETNEIFGIFALIFVEFVFYFICDEINQFF